MTHARVRSAAAIALVCLLAAGCGSSKSASYAPGPTASCLLNAGVFATTDAANPLWPGALEVDADLGGRDVYVGFGDAHTLGQAVDAAANGAPAAITSGNAVYYSNMGTVTPAAATLVQACLDGDTQAARSAARHVFAAIPPQRYDQAFLGGFYDRCMGGGGVGSQCDCVVANAEQRYTLNEFGQITAALGRPRDSLYPLAQRLIDLCRNA